jgi:hypothetical protein
MRKKIINIILGIFSLTGIIPLLNPPTASAQASVSFQVFYDQLSPFGTWVSYPGYGYVWVPGAGSGFRPYGTRGHWVYTDEGWTWVSDYSWGWATFHYGNWFYDNSYGWMWLPGYQWAPAWVTWGEYGGNYCWAPIGPNINIGIAFGTYRPPYNYWNFCPYGHITSVNLSHYYVTNIRNASVINHIAVINNVHRGSGSAFLRGPAPANVERYTHTPVRPLAIRSATGPGAANVGHGQLAIYRPAVQANHASARPSALRDIHAIRPVNRAPARPAQPAASVAHTTAVTHASVQNGTVAHTSRTPTNNYRSQTRPVNHTTMQQHPPVQQHYVQQHPIQPHPVQPHSMQAVRQSPPAAHPGMPVVRNQPPPPHEAPPHEHH